MSDAYIPSFFSDDPRTGALTYGQLEARRRIAAALATRNRPYPKTIGEGLSALGEGLGEGYMMRGLERAEAAQLARDQAAGASLIGGAPPAAAPAARPAPGPVSMEDGGPVEKALASAIGTAPEGDVSPVMAALAPAGATATRQPITPEQARQQPSMSIEEWKTRIARNESGGRRDAYTLVGERSRRGDYPYGKYQVMGENIPKWTKGYLGREMTPKEFLADPDAQEQLATAKGSEYMAKYGPNGAAAAWFAGEKGMNDPNRTDTLGTHVAEYGRRFNIPLVSREQVVASAARAPTAAAFAPEEPQVQLASLGGAPAREAITEQLSGPPPQSAPQQVPPQIMAQAPQQRTPIGAAPQPVPPTATPIVPPQAVPKPPAQPAQPADPGPEPQLQSFVNNPQLKQQMDNARRIALDETLNPTVRAQAQARYKELMDIAKDAYTKQWTVWHERDKVLKEHQLGADKRELEATKMRGEAEDAAEKRILVHRLGGQDPQKFFDNFKTEQSSAEIASRMMSDNQLIIKAVKDGVIMGTGAGWRLNAAKLASWALQNGYASEVAANTEITRALAGSRIREAMSQINPSGPASNVDLLISRQLSGTEPSMEAKSFMQLLHKSNNYNAKMLNDYEDKRDYYLSGTRAERQFQINAGPTAPQPYVDALLKDKDNKALRAEYDERFGEGSAALEIERAKRKARRGQ